MKISTFTEEKIIELTQEINKIKKELKELRIKTINCLWTEDLENLCI